MNIDMIHAAAARAGDMIRETPLLESPALSDIADIRLLLKAENLQHTGSFKARGGWAAVSAMSDAARAKGVIATSSGNHAQGVARAAHYLGTNAQIVMPSDAPAAKVNGTRAWGADIIPYDRIGDDRIAIAERLSNDQGLTYIPPYDHEQVIAGQGTCGLEIAQQAKDLGIDNAEVIICCSGGGLASGSALALEAEMPNAILHTAEPEHFDDTARSLASGQHEINAPGHTSICDAILSPTPGHLTFPIVKTRYKDGFSVTDDDVLHAMGLAFAHLKLVIEPGGAVALAAALKHRARLTHDTVIVTASGGNVDAAIFAKALETL